MKQIAILTAIACASISLCMAQPSGVTGSGKAQKDSLAHVRMVEDSLKMEKLFAIAQYPYVKGSRWSGVIPVTDPAEIPDPNHEYKLLFEVTAMNPDSLAKEINFSLDEVARVLNLHVASGIPGKMITPVILVHGPAVEAIANNELYRKRHSMDNPNLKIIQDLKDVGAKFIVCGQAMAFFDLTKADLLPGIKISLTAQTVLSNYQTKGFVLYTIKPDR